MIIFRLRSCYFSPILGLFILLGVPQHPERERERPKSAIRSIRRGFFPRRSPRSAASKSPSPQETVLLALGIKVVCLNTVKFTKPSLHHLAEYCSRLRDLAFAQPKQCFPLRYINLAPNSFMVFVYFPSLLLIFTKYRFYDLFLTLGPLIFAKFAKAKKISKNQICCTNFQIIPFLLICLSQACTGRLRNEAFSLEHSKSKNNMCAFVKK